MSRFNGMVGAPGSGTQNSQAGGSGDLIRNFVKENPDFMKLNSTQRSRMLMELKQHAKEEELMMKKGAGFRLPGTTESDQEMSESVQATMKQMMDKKLQNRKLKLTEIKPMWFSGGRLDKMGNIYDEQGMKIGTIDRTNNKIKLNGQELGFYDKNGPSGSIIKSKVREYNKQTYHKAVQNTGMWGGNNVPSANNTAWFFGNKDDSGGGFWN